MEMCCTRWKCVASHVFAVCMVLIHDTSLLPTVALHGGWRHGASVWRALCMVAFHTCYLGYVSAISYKICMTMFHTCYLGCVSAISYKICMTTFHTCYLDYISAISYKICMTTFHTCYLDYVSIISYKIWCTSLATHMPIWDLLIYCTFSLLMYA